jgi:hypothetical protein
MPKNLRISSRDLTDYYRCPVHYYMRKVGLAPEFTPAKRYEYVNGCIDRAILATIEDYANGTIDENGLDPALLAYTLEGLNQGVRMEQNAWLAEVFQEHYFSAHRRLIARFIRMVLLPRNELAGQTLEVDRGRYTLSQSAPIYADKTLHLLTRGRRGGTIFTYPQRYASLLEPYYLLTSNGYPVEDIVCCSIKEGSITHLAPPNSEEMATFQYHMDYVADAILRQDYYPRPCKTCIGCTNNSFCENLQLGNINIEVNEP